MENILFSSRVCAATGSLWHPSGHTRGQARGRVARACVTQICAHRQL